MGKESSERPNDPISKRGLEDSMMKLAIVQEAQRARKGKKGTQQMMAFGGRKYRGDLDVPYMIYDPYMGSPEQVAEEETFYDDLKKLTNGNMESLSPSIITSEGNPMPTIIDTNAYADFIGRVQDDERIRNFLASVPEMESEESVNALDEAFQKEVTANLPQIVTPEGAASVSKNNNKNSNEEKYLPTYLRYTPTIGSAFGAIQSLFQKPDYENADILMQEARNLSRPSVRYRALNNYLTYRPLDRNYYLNQLKGQAGATRRGIMNSGSNAGNVMAGLLAADYNAQNAVGKTLMQMEQYNDAQRQRIAEFNRGTDQYNAQAAMSADAQNAQLAQNRDRLRSSLMTQAAQMREASDTALEATRSANLTNFFDNLGGIGRENMGWNWTKYLADSGTFGQLRGGVPMPGFRKGGMLTKRNRRRR